MVATGFEFELPIGFIAEGGVHHRVAGLRKMTGHEEALLFDPQLTAAGLITALLERCVVRLGTIERPSASVIRELYSADRNALLLALRRITLGDRVDAHFDCPGCGAAVVTHEDLSQIEVRRLPPGAELAATEIELVDGYEDRSGEVHRAITLVQPRGVDEEFVARTALTDPLRARDALLLRCITRFGTLRSAELEGYGGKILRDLTLGDRRLLYRALDADGPGVDFRRRVRCGECGTRFQTMIDAADFFALG